MQLSVEMICDLTCDLRHWFKSSLQMICDLGMWFDLWFAHYWHSMYYVATPGVPSVTITRVTNSSVTLTISRPRDTKAILYAIEYRKQGQRVWITTSESSRLSLIISGLQSGTGYQFKVTAKYAGGVSTSESAVLYRITKQGSTSKCLNFSFYILRYLWVWWTSFRLIIAAVTELLFLFFEYLSNSLIN